MLRYLAQNTMASSDSGCIPTSEAQVAEGGKAVLKLITAKGQEANGKFFKIHVPGWDRIRD